MGNYTRFHFNVRLTKSTPPEVVGFLDKTINQGDIGLQEGEVMFKPEDVPVPDLRHAFFLCSRWYALFMSKNWGDLPPTSFGTDPQYGYHHLIIDSEFKNHEDEIGKFIEWVSPWIAGRKKKQYIGWEKHELSTNRTNHYIER